MSIVKRIFGSRKLELPAAPLTRSACKNEIANGNERQKNDQITRAIFEASQDAIFIMSDGRFVDCNARTLSMFGGKRKHIIGKAPYALSPGVQPDGRQSNEKAREKINAALRGEPQHFDWVHKKLDGALFDAEVSLSCCDHLGEKRIIAIVRDATERKNAERALLESEAKYRILVNNANEAILVAQDGVIKYSNPAGVTITGYPEEELVGVPFLNFIHAEDREMVAANYQKRLDGKSISQFYQFRIITKSGNFKWVRISAALIDWENRPATLNFFTDVTQQKKAAEAQQRNEILMRMMADNFPNAYVTLLDKNLTIIYAGGQEFKKQNKNPDDMIGKNIGSIFNHFGKKLVKDLETRAQMTFRGEEQSFDLETRNHHFFMQAVPIEDNAGHIEQILAVAENVTKQKEIEKKVKESEEKFRLTFDNASDAIYLLELTKKGVLIRAANAAACKSHGYQAEELLGQPASMLIDEKRRPTIGRIVERLQAGETLRYEATDKRKDGSTFPIEISARMVTIENTPYVLSIERDISERKQAEKKLKQQHALLSATLDSTADGILVVMGAKHVVRTNAKFMEMWRIPAKIEKTNDRHELTHSVLNQLVDPDAFVAKIKELDQSEDESFDVLLFKDGRVFERHSNPLQLSENIRGRVFSFRDVTEKKTADAQIAEYQMHLEALVKERTGALEKKTAKMIEAQKAMRYLVEDANDARKQVEQTNEMLSESNKQLEAFTYSVSHDLRAPLRAVSGFSNKLGRLYGDNLDAEGHRLLKVINDNTIKMDQLIEDLLAFSRISRTVVNTTTVDMSVLAREISDELRLAHPLLKIEFSIAPLPEAQGDPRLLRQALFNLMENAVKYSSKNDILKIDVCRIDNNGEPSYCVKDNGVGFDMQYADKLFNVFHRLHADNEFQGTGVGLAIAQLIIHRHNGKIWAEAKPNEGAAFYFTVPLAEQQPAT